MPPASTIAGLLLEHTESTANMDSLRDGLVELMAYAILTFENSRCCPQ